MIAVLIPQSRPRPEQSLVFSTLDTAPSNTVRSSIPRSRKPSSMGGGGVACRTWKPHGNPGQIRLSVCLNGGSRWKNIHPVILHNTWFPLEYGMCYNGLIRTHGMDGDGRWTMDDGPQLHRHDLVQDTHPHGQDGIYQSALLTAAENHGYVQK